MCIAPLPHDNLQNMKIFKYTMSDESLLYNRCFSPFLNRLVKYFPLWLSPNLIILMSLFLNIIAVIISYKDGGFDFSLGLKRKTCFVIGFFQLIYQLLDIIDGKQARRTGSFTPFTILLDHGCDIFITVFTAFNLSKLVLVGNENIFSFSIFFGLILGFYVMTYQEYKIGEMHFPQINGTDEGNFSIFLLGIYCAIFGQNNMKYIVNDDNSITVTHIISVGVVLGGLSTVLNLFLYIYQKKGLKEASKIFLDITPLYAVIFVPLLFILFHIEFYKDHKWIILANACLIFARITLDIQIKIITLDILTYNFMYIFSNIAFIFSLFLYYDIAKLYFLLLLLVAQVTELTIFIFKRAKEISDFLEVKIFCISNPPSQL